MSGRNLPALQQPIGFVSAGISLSVKLPRKPAKLESEHMQGTVHLEDGGVGAQIQIESKTTRAREVLGKPFNLHSMGRPPLGL